MAGKTIFVDKYDEGFPEKDGYYVVTDGVIVVIAYYFK